MFLELLVVDKCLCLCVWYTTIITKSLHLLLSMTHPVLILLPRHDDDATETLTTDYCNTIDRNN